MLIKRAVNPLLCLINLCAVAIALTKCELATARLKTPLECEGISLQSAQGGDGWKIPHADSETSDTDHSLAMCVEALSRSSQFWSTYSGYMREASQLCFTLNQAAEINFAKDVYRNITMEKQAILKLMKANAESIASKSQKDAKHYQRHHEELKLVYESIFSLLEASLESVSMALCPTERS